MTFAAAGPMLSDIKRYHEAEELWSEKRERVQDGTDCDEKYGGAGGGFARPVCEDHCRPLDVNVNAPGDRDAAEDLQEVRGCPQILAKGERPLAPAIGSNCAESRGAGSATSCAVREPLFLTSK